MVDAVILVVGVCLAYVVGMWMGGKREAEENQLELDFLKNEMALKDLLVDSYEARIDTLMKTLSEMRGEKEK